MSNSSSEQSINISPQNVYGKCDLKCAYNFKYKESNTTAQNNGINISLTYESSSTLPVLYNAEKYSVAKIMIFAPSLHLFNGNNVDAEIIVEHTPEMGGPNLFVCVPVIKSSETSTASNLLTQVIASVASNAPAEGESSNLNLSGFTLQDIITNKHCYNYSGSYSQTTGDFIVFGQNYAIPLNEKVLSALSSIIQPFPLPMTGEKLFLNQKGPNSSGEVGGGIYISCQPTGSSEEEVEITNTKNGTSFDFGEFFNNSTVKLIFQIIIGCIIFGLIFLAINYAFNMLTSSPISLSSLKLPNFKKTVQ
jgi:hypothetical protein